ncbi:hypothetical protein ACFQ1S_24310, partial [Kibdelosporangium lantanae]
DDPRARLGRLGAAIPELTPDVLCMAFLMAQRGAEAALLVRTFRLTWQSFRYQAVTNVATNNDGPATSGCSAS